MANTPSTPKELARVFSSDPILTDELQHLLDEFDIKIKAAIRAKLQMCVARNEVNTSALTVDEQAKAIKLFVKSASLKSAYIKLE